MLARRRDLWVLALGLGVAVAFMLHAGAWAFLSDDAFISFRYARNLAQEGSLSFNPLADPPERVEGYTNFAWVLVLALLARVGIEPHVAAPVLTQASAGLGLVVASLLVHRLRKSFGVAGAGGRSSAVSSIDLVPAMLLVALPEWMVWSQGGLETAMATALVVGAMAAFVGQHLVVAAILTAAAGLTRADALLGIAGFGLTWMLVVGVPHVRGPNRRDVLSEIPWRRVGLALLVCVVPLMAHLVWRRIYYGAWLPNTWTIKAHGRLLRDSYGIAYVEAWMNAVHLVHLAPLVVLLRPRHLLLAVPIALIVGYGWWVGGDFMAYSRFYTTATALLAVLVGWLLADFGQMLLRRFPAGRWVMTVPVSLALLTAGGMGSEARARWALDRETGTKWIDGKWEGVTAMHRFALVGFAVGRWMHENLPPDTWITVGAAGAVPYGSRVNVIDAYGLVDPHLASMPEVRPHTGRGARPGHQLHAPPEYILSRDPDLLCHVGFRGSTRPPEQRAHPSFRRGYVWACIEPDPVPDPAAGGQLFDVGVYCCRRPRDRVVGPFGAQEGS